MCNALDSVGGGGGGEPPASFQGQCHGGEDSLLKYALLYSK